jgi:hypothetical protein
MKKLISKFPLLILAISLISLSSCIDIDRKIKINADGSGSETQTFNIDRTFYDLIFSMVNGMDSTKSKGLKDSLYNHEDMLKQIRNNFSKQEGAELIDLTGVTNEDSSTTYKFTYTFTKVDKLGFATNISPKELSGEEKSTSEVLWKDNGNTVYFSLLYKPKDEGENSNESNNQAFAFMFEKKNIKFEIEFPYDIEKSNGKNFNGRTGSWIFPLEEIMKGKDNKLFLEATLKK